MKQWSLAAVHCCFINQYYIWRWCLNACIIVVWVKQSSVIRNDQTKQTKSLPQSRRINSKHNSTRGIEHWNHPLFYNCINPSVTERWLDWWRTIVFSKTRLVPTESSCGTITAPAFSVWPVVGFKPHPSQNAALQSEHDWDRGTPAFPSTSTTNSFSASEGCLQQPLILTAALAPAKYRG